MKSGRAIFELASRQLAKNSPLLPTDPFEPPATIPGRQGVLKQAALPTRPGSRARKSQ